MLVSWLWWASIALAQTAAQYPPVDDQWLHTELGEKDAALVVAIEDYAYLPPVPGAEQTGTDWESFFLRHRGIPEERVFLLQGKHATREAILRRAALAAQETPAGGTLWMVFVGHGAPDVSLEDGLFIGVDTQQTAHSLSDRGVRRTEVEAALGRGKQEHTVLIIDACFSGRSPGSTMLVPGLSPVLATRLAPAPETTVLAAGKGDEFAGPLPGMSRPAFSYLLLGALRGWADRDEDGSVTAGEAVSYARGMLLQLQDRTQTPEIVGDDLPMAVSAGEPAPDLRAVIRNGGLSGPSVVSTPVGSGGAAAGRRGKRIRTSFIVGGVALGLYGGGVGVALTEETRPRSASTARIVANNTLMIGSVAAGATAAVLLVRGLATPSGGRLDLAAARAWTARRQETLQNAAPRPTTSY